MRGRLQLLGAAAALSMAVAATGAYAQHNAPAKAKGLKIDMVTAYEACVLPGNDNQGSSPPLPACHPPTPSTNLTATHKVTFGPKGTANVQVGVGTGDVKLKVKSVDILDNGVTIADGQQLGLHIDSAISTSNACQSGDPAGCTTFDLGILFDNQFKATCLKGKCSLSSTVNTLLGSSTISAGTRANISIAGAGINDQDGDVAFREGIFIP